MPMSNLRITTTTAVVLAASLSAQVPPGAAVMSNISNVAPMEGVLLVTRAGTATPITGLALTARASHEINSIQLDPVDDRVWIGGISPVVGRVDTFTVAGTAVANFTAIGNTGNGGSISGIAFDLNGNAMCSSGTLSTTGTGGIFRADRQTNAITRLVGGATWPFLGTGTANCVCTDPSGNLYFGQTLNASIYMLAPGPNGDYSGVPVLVGVALPPSSSATISSVEYAPANGARPAILWWTTFGAAGTAIGTMALPAGPAVAVGPSPFAPNWVDYDALNDDFWLINGGINPDVVMTMNHLGAQTLVAQVPPAGVNGSPSAIDANDCRPGTTTILPQFVPSPGGAVRVEIGTCCPPGSIGGVAIISPTVATLVVGNAGADGRIFASFPGVFLAAGTPNTVTLISACFNPATGVLTVGQPVTWPRN